MQNSAFLSVKASVSVVAHAWEKRNSVGSVGSRATLKVSRRDTSNGFYRGENGFVAISGARSEGPAVCGKLRMESDI